MNNKKGQLSIEYILLMAIIIIVLVYMARPGGQLQSSINSVILQQADDANRVADQIFN